jgi:hypothetical protein
MTFLPLKLDSSLEIQYFRSGINSYYGVVAMKKAFDYGKEKVKAHVS